MAKAEPRVVGIDPSVTSTGLAFADGSTTVVKDRKVDGDKRLVAIYFSTSMAVMTADFCVLEDLPRNAMGAGATGQAQGAVRIALQNAAVPYIALSPATVKKASVGKGNADKKQMVAAIPSELGITSHDEADAWWMRQAGRSLLGLDNHLADESALDKYREDPVVAALREVWD